MSEIIKGCLGFKGEKGEHGEVGTPIPYEGTFQELQNSEENRDRFYIIMDEQDEVYYKHWVYYDEKTEQWKDGGEYLANLVINLEDLTQEEWESLKSNLTNYYKRYESIYTTTQENEINIPINISQYNTLAILEVYIEGRMLNRNEYAINGTNSITLNIPLSEIGTKVHFIVYRSVCASNEDLNELKGPKGDSGAIVFDTIAEMKADTDLVAGDTCQTLGYYSANDGGAGLYKIVSSTAEDDGGSIHILDNGLRAELVVKDSINIKQFGAKGDGITDDTTYIKKAVNYLFSIQNTEKTAKGKINTLNFPAGNYRITSQIKIPMQVHIKSIGCVNFYTEVPNDSAFWFYAEDDVQTDGYKGDAFREKTLGDLINGENGGFSFINNLGATYNSFIEGDTHGGIGVEIGTRTQTTPWKTQNHITIKNIRVELYEIGLQLNTYHMYIQKYEKIIATKNVIGIRHGDGTSGISDTGENIRYSFCNISNNKVGFLINSNNGFEACFDNCSIDFNILAILNLRSDSPSCVKLNGCHIEGQYSKEYCVARNITLQPYQNNDNYYGIYLNAYNNDFAICSISLNDCNLAFTATGHLIKSAGNRKTKAIFTNVRISSNFNYDKYLSNKDWLFICDENVITQINGIDYVDRRNGPFPDKSQCLTIDPTFSKLTVGQKYEKSAGSVVLPSGFTVRNMNNTTGFTVVADNSVGGNVLRFDKTSSDPANNPYFTIESKPVNVRNGNPVIFTSSIKMVGNFTISYYLVCYDADGNNIGRLERYITGNCDSLDNYYSYVDRQGLPLLPGTSKIALVALIGAKPTTDTFDITNFYVYQF